MKKTELLHLLLLLNFANFFLKRHLTLFSRVAALSQHASFVLSLTLTIRLTLSEALSLSAASGIEAAQQPLVGFYCLV